jgi:hypothetical protein
MERTATARRKLVAKPTRLPAGVDLARLEEEGAVRALRVLVVAVERAVARKDLVGQGGGARKVAGRRCPQLDEDQGAYGLCGE